MTVLTSKFYAFVFLSMLVSGCYKAPPAKHEDALTEKTTSDPSLQFWASRVKKKIELKWQSHTKSLKPGKKFAEVTFNVLRDGTIKDVSLKQSSADSLFDFLALSAIEDIESLPPIPAGFPKDTIFVNYQFEHD
ncbi:MAG: hypothetical protein JWO30_3077 [Fibrobacteres bacterium]|nr:hypothetical protein [Fibrobacterota bacterium]